MIAPSCRDCRLARIAQIDYAAPVLEIQQAVTRLRVWRQPCGIGFLITGCFMWTPLTLSVFHVLGADIWVHKPEVVGWFLPSSLAAS